MSNNWVPYYIDHSVKNVSKTFGVAKKRVLFKFGFANQDALKRGLEGSNCRGTEHEVVFVWSLASGKRLITVDNQNIHFSETGENGWFNDQLFQHQFHLNVKGHGVFRCVLFTQPVNKNVPGQGHPFDLRVNGVSFFNFSQIYQLGTGAMIVRDNGPVAGRGSDEPISADERKALAQARLESMKDYRKQQEKSTRSPSSVTENSAARSAPAAMARNEEASLISFDNDGPPPQGVPISSVSSLTVESQGQQYQRMQQQQQNLNYNPHQAQPQQQLYGAPPPYGGSASSGSFGPQPTSSALTPYGGSASAPGAPYVDATGRLTYGSPQPSVATGASPMQPQQQQQQQPQQAWGGSSTYSAPNSYNPAAQQQGAYGSAPAFAQPPQQQGFYSPPQQQQQPPQYQQQYAQQQPPPQPQKLFDPYS